MQQRRTKTMNGLGLVLSRYAGEKIIIKAAKDATDQELLDALKKDGIILTMVDMIDYKHPGHSKSRRVAKIGIGAPKSISILREEISEKYEEKTQ